MYKSNLQELCHKRQWALPKYSAMKDGPDHMPSFKASVFVNGVAFTSTDCYNTSKEAHNQAAKVAFLNFSSAPPGSSMATTEYDTKDQVGAAQPQDIPIPAHSSVTKDEMNRLCKNQLQNYARRNNLDPPIFTIETEGPPHKTHFKAEVVVDGQSFESPAFYNTIKEAEQAAAKIALMSLSIDIYKKGASGLFKNLLLELTQREGFCKPTYKTKHCGSPHMPTFFSTVEVEGEEFHGKASRSKKQAEHDAARIAYIALKECGLNMYAASSNMKQTLKHEDEHLDMDSNDILPANVKISNEVYNPPFPLAPAENMMSNRSSSSSPNSSSFLLCNRFKVYTCFPDHAFPEGITVLPISENKWVAVSLEFPNDKDL